ncbi:MAG: hypothetical protein ACKOZY_07170, partial [Flavobacteriales bacterium]
SPEIENVVIGTCLGIPSGKISEPIQGQGGIFVVTRSADVVAPNTNDNYATDHEMLLTAIGKANYASLLRSSLVETLEVEDLRNSPK